MTFVDKKIENMPKGNSRQNVNVNRAAAKRFEESGKVDNTAEFTLFGQIF